MRTRSYNGRRDKSRLVFLPCVAWTLYFLKDVRGSSWRSTVFLIRSAVGAHAVHDLVGSRGVLGTKSAKLYNPARGIKPFRLGSSSNKHGSRPMGRHCVPAVKNQGLRVSWRSVFFVLLAAALSLLGFTMPGPILPALRTIYGLSAGETGLISSSFAAGMFFAVLFLPSTSDRVGRRPIMATALALTAVGFFFQGIVVKFGLSFRMFLITRTLTGLFAGCNPIFKAYLADVVPPARLAQFMVYRESSATLAFLVGPILGGYLASLASIGPSGPLFATAVAQALGALLVATQIEESVKVRGVGVSRSAEKDRELKRIRWWPVLVVFAASFFYVMGQSCITSYVPLLMNDEFGSTPRDIGIFTTKVSVVAFVFQVVCYRIVQRRLGLVMTGTCGALSICAGLVGMGFPTIIPFGLSSVIYALGVALFPATIPTLLAQVVPQSSRGFILGLDSVGNNVCRVFAPLLLGMMYSRTPALCFGGAGVAMLIAALTISTWPFAIAAQTKAA